MHMKLKEGKSKVLTLSYDDGVIQDNKLFEIMLNYGIKGTFNINTGLYFPEEKERTSERIMRMKLSEAQKLYINSYSEIAVHGYEHKNLGCISQEEVVNEVIRDRENIEKQYGVITRGMAYSFGAYNEHAIETIEKCGICYARTVFSTENFNFPKNWFEFNPTCHHNNSRLMELAKKFVEMSVTNEDNLLFYLWGHSYEFDVDDNWHIIEQFCNYVGKREDIWYATNIEIYDYVKAYENLQCGECGDTVYNPSVIDVWFVEGEKIYCVHSGETIKVDNSNI